MVDFDFYKNKKVLITGDTGFKGSWLSLWLNILGADVYGYSLPAEREYDHFEIIKLKNDIKHKDGNILDYEMFYKTVSEIQPEIVFHLAAQALVRYSYDEPKITFDTNVAGSVNVLEAIRNLPSVKSLIFVTSDKCYKNKEWIYGYRENDELGGHDPYSASKAAAEMLYASYYNSYFKLNKNIGVASVRAGNVMGGGDWAPDRIIPDCVRAITNNKVIEIRNPNATRPWQHVLEPLSGYMLLAQRLYEKPIEFSGSWNFGPTGKSIKTVKELTDKVIELFGKGSIEIMSSDGFKHESGLLHLNCDKANHQLKWNSVWNFEKTVTTTIEWYKMFLEGKEAREISINNINQFMGDFQL